MKTRKNILIAATGITASLVLLYACQKSVNGLTQPKPSLTASSTNVAVGQAVSLSVVNAPLGTHNEWASSLLRSTAFSAASAHDAVNVSFSKPGTYVITCNFASGVGADSLPKYDTTRLPNDTSANPHDSVPNYHPPHDSTNTHGDTTHYSGDTTHYSGDTTHYSGDTTHYSGDTTHYSGDTTHYSGDSTRYPSDTTHHSGDTTHNYIDSTHNATGHTVVNSVSIIIVVH